MSGFRTTAALALFPVMTLFGGEVSTISPSKALEMINNPATYLVDVRSIAEYYLVGHPFWNETRQDFERNENFARDIQARFKKNDVLVFICRSGGRSRRAAEAALEAGFAEVYNVDEGFEGEKDENGLRTIGGWRNRGLPHTYDINPDLIYRGSEAKGDSR
jgi:rhodanese-related sulfurtransferase